MADCCPTCGVPNEPGLCMDRPTYKCDDLEMTTGYGNRHTAKEQVRIPAEPEEANLVGSLINQDIHLPVFDIDYGARLIPSSTEGHYHLYLDRPCKWRDYRRVLKAMAKAGLIQKGFADHSIRRKEAFVRKPGVKKGA